MSDGPVVAVDPLVKRVRVEVAVEDAFRRFTAGIGDWWPLETHSLGQKNAESCVFEGRVGGRLYEVQRDGTECVWGTVLRWDPPAAVAVSWHPDKDESLAGRVEVTFEAAGDATEVTLTHSGWELLGEEAEKTRAGYDTGWEYVLGRYGSL